MQTIKEKVYTTRVEKSIIYIKKRSQKSQQIKASNAKP